MESHLCRSDDDSERDHRGHPQFGRPGGDEGEKRSEEDAPSEQPLRTQELRETAPQQRGEHVAVVEGAQDDTLRRGTPCVLALKGIGKWDEGV